MSMPLPASIRSTPSPAVLLAAIALVVAVPASAQSLPPAPADEPVVVVVRVPRPWYAPTILVTSRMRDTLPQYASLNGLAFKAYSYDRADGRYGGLYLWRDAASASAWFDPAWFERVERERGAKADVRRLAAPVTIDNVAGGTPESDHADGIATLVSVPIPPGIDRARLVQGFRAAVPQYAASPGLLRKSFTIGEDGTFGGLYLWRDEASARRWFDGAWHAKVKATYGAQASIEWYDTPILLPTRVAANRVATVAP